MEGYVENIVRLSLENTNFKKVLYTDKNSQLVLMSLPPAEEIGECTNNVDQYIRIEKGKGRAILSMIPHDIGDGSVVIIPSGTKHNIINTGKTIMKLYTIYMPPLHDDGLVHKTKAEAEAAEEKDCREEGSEGSE